MDVKAPPDEYEDLIRAVHERYADMSKTNKLIAEYVTQYPNETAVGSVNSLAARCGVHASSLVRFAQTFGFSGFRDLQDLFQRRLVTAAPGFEARAARLRTEIEERAHPGGLGHLREVALRDIASIEDLLDSVSEADLDRAVDLMKTADTIYLVGQLRSEPIVNLMRYVLTMIGRRTVLLNPGGGLATHMAKVIGPDDMLFAVSFRFYATEVVNITEEVAARGVPIVAITDSSLSPLAKSAEVLFAIPEPEYTFSRSLAAPMCLAHALTLALAASLRDDGEAGPLIPVATAD
ncbi:MAG: MurR/RpiR family transcriptional regulator [Rhodobiaceae bacterium]|nr:MurR/RpiR family transcriptional regulator [Rhodobiaceae bacterium]